MLSVGKSISSPTAEVVGPNWTVNTVPGFAPKVVTASAAPGVRRDGHPAGLLCDLPTQNHRVWADAALKILLSLLT